MIDQTILRQLLASVNNVLIWPLLRVHCCRHHGHRAMICYGYNLTICNVAILWMNVQWSARGWMASMWCLGQFPREKKW